MSFITKGLKEVEAGYRLMARTLRIGEARAVARAGTSAKTQMTRQITGRLNLRAGTVRDELKVKREPSTAHLDYTLTAKTRGVPLREFVGTRQTRKGVSVAVVKGARATLGAAFGISKYGGHFFGRVGIGSSKYGSPHVGRGPIVKLFGPSVATQFAREDVQQRGEQTWNERIPIELEREQTFALKKAGLL